MLVVMELYDLDLARKEWASYVVSESKNSALPTLGLAVLLVGEAASFIDSAIPQSFLLEDDRAGFGGTTMQSKTMKAVLFVVNLLFVCNVLMLAQSSQNPANAQSNNVRDQDIAMLRTDLRSQRKQITAQNMILTADEATKFWPIFDQYRQEAIKPNDERWALLKEYADNYSNMTDAQSQDYIKRSTAVDQQLLALRMKYVPVFEKVISPRKTALWYQIDRRIDLLINLQLSTLIPMVDTTK